MAKCKVGEILALVDSDENEALIRALNEREGNGFVWSAKNLSHAIGKTQYSVGATTIKEHRRKVCGCY